MLAIVPPLALIAVLFRYRMRNAFREARVKVARLNAHLQETITGMKLDDDRGATVLDATAWRKRQEQLRQRDFAP